jgi:RimJ/RimL family protein N-acetyltransferase
VSPAPELVTERLVLRGWRDSDLEAYAEMAADPEVMRHLGGPMDRAGAWRLMALYAGHWALRGYGNWVVEREGVTIGRCGLWRPEGWPGLELGWKLARGAWGHGYATEAARAAMDWAWNELRAPRLISIVDPENTPSARVAERLGMRHVRDEVVNGRPGRIFAIERS